MVINDFKAWVTKNDDALDIDLIRSRFTDEQMLVMLYWLEESYEQGHTDGRYS